MADRTLTIKIGANVTDLVSKIRTAQQATQQWADKTQSSILSNSGHLSTLSTSFGLVGAGMVAASGLAVKSFADFDAAMSSVQASTMESADNMALLREAALDAGQETVYSATEAAAAIEELAKAGVSTEDILSGGLSGALNLAASGALDVGKAAEIAASAMTQFGLSGGDVEHVADLLAAGAGKAQGSVEDMGMALNQSGLVAAQMGLSIEETTGTLTAFASAGLVGSDAGTSFRQMLLRLANPTKESAELMSELGISAYDAQGNFVGMESLASQLQTRLGSLTQEQRNAALATIFGSDAIRSASILYEEGAEGVAEWTAAVDDQGYAAEQAAIRMDNLKGDIEGFMGALETALIGAGEGANGPLRSLVQSATDAVNKFSELPAPVQQATTLIAGGAGLALLGAATMMKLVTQIAEARAAMQALGITTDGIKGKFAGLGKAAGTVAGVTAGVLLLAKALDSVANANHNVETSTALMMNALNGVGDDTIDDVFAMTDGIDGLSDSFTKLTGTDATNSINRWASDTFGFLGLTDSIADSRAQFEALGQTLAQMPAEEAAAQFSTLVESLGGGAEVQEQLLELMPTYRDALAEQEGATAAAASTTDVATASIEAQTDALQDNIDAMREAAGIILDEREARRNYKDSVDAARTSLDDFRQSLIDEAIENGKSQEAAEAAADAAIEQGAALDITTEAGRQNQAALDDVAESGWDLIDSMKANGATAGDLQSSMKGVRDRFIETATSMGMSEDAAAELADQMGLIPTEINSAVNVETATAQSNVDGFISRNDGRRLTIWVDSATGAQTGFRNAGSSLVGMATGGAVYGPGSGTSDSVLARLSAGEHVWTAREVAALGGHGAMLTLRQAALTGKLSAATPGYATGGPVLGSAGVGASVAPVVAGKTYSATVQNFGRPVSDADILRALRKSELLDV